MADTFYMRRNDNLVTIRLRCLDGDGAAVSLAGVSTLKLQVKKKADSAAILNVDATADVDQVTNKGRCSVSLTRAQIDVPGNYMVCVQATWPDTTALSFPTNQSKRPAWLVIEEKLA